MDDRAPGKKRWPRRLAIILLVIVGLIILTIVGFLIYASDYYHDADITHANLVSTEQVSIEHGQGYVAFGNERARTGIVFYPGAKVEYTAYAPLMRDLADRGYLAIVVQMPLNFAFLDIGAADSVEAHFPAVGSWWVGGHSLGGAMAAQYAASHQDDPSLEGIILLGAYSAADLSASRLGAIVIYGSEDGVLNRAALSENAKNLPDSAQTVEIAGGNHAQFGDYGVQSGDGVATIPIAAQQEQTAKAIDAYIQTAISD